MLECSYSKRMFKISLKFQGSSKFFSSLTLKSYNRNILLKSYKMREMWIFNPTRTTRMHSSHFVVNIKINMKKQIPETPPNLPGYPPITQNSKGKEIIRTKTMRHICIYWKHSERTYHCRNPNIPSIHLKQKIHNTEHIENLSTCRSWSILPIQPIQDTNAPQS